MKAKKYLHLISIAIAACVCRHQAASSISSETGLLLFFVGILPSEVHRSSFLFVCWVLVVDKVCCEEEEEEEEEKIIRLLLLLLLLWLNVQEYKTEKETLNEYSIKTAYGIESEHFMLFN
ncbi:hypothetical protein T4D_2031 [Trichinella pseudospiralis]|uniref:Uncharacterized protein n=1 Tax=Trichinella pseudospiralis TaxID=6337 RepID=A0A0V1FH13_TRIPS|nr:hypothetical protein T4D_2031 [Trichinella pseudospiralis]